MRTAYIICDNDMMLHVVVGSEELAKAKLEEYRTQIFETCRKSYGEEQAADYFSRHYLHIHDVPCDCPIHDEKISELRGDVLDLEWEVEELRDRWEDQ